MQIEVLYDSERQPCRVLMSWDEHQELLARVEVGELLRARFSELQKFLNDVLTTDENPTELPPDEIDSAEEEPIAEVIARDSFDERKSSLRYYKGARGYYMNGKQFKVIKGSLASGRTSSAFEERSYGPLRRRLINSGVLARERDWGPYTFTADYVFNSPSAAASIIDGNQRSGPEAWGCL